jgi:hypothetical protein
MEHKKENEKKEQGTVNDQKENKSPEKKPESAKVIIVDFTAFNVRGERIFFNKSIEEVKFELMEACNTAVIHKTIEYDLTVNNKIESELNTPVEITSKYEENTFALLKARRNIIKVSKSVVNKRTAGKLIKESERLDDIIIHEKLD